VIPVDEILESLDLSRAEPGSGFLEALFARFNARVPFENASKIVRDAEIADGEAKPRTPEIFWADHLESGTGGTCFARVAAFDALLSALGFRTRRLVGKVRSDYDHAALLIATPTGESIADVFRSIGGEIRQSWCGPCFGQGPDALTQGQRAITSFNRNWQNRMGLGGEGYLASPAVVAASALVGYMAPPSELGLTWEPERFGV